MAWADSGRGPAKNIRKEAGDLLKLISATKDPKPGDISRAISIANGRKKGATVNKLRTLLQERGHIKRPAEQTNPGGIAPLTT